MSIEYYYAQSLS